MTDVGAHVVVVGEKVAPAPIEHPALFQPLAPVTEAAAESAPVSNAQSVVQLVKADASGTSQPGSAAVAAAPAAGAAAESLAHGLRAKPSDSPLRILITRRTGRERLMDVQRLLKLLGYAPGDIDGYMGPETASAIRDFQHAHDQVQSGLYSKQLLQDLSYAAGKGDVIEGHIYVRQDFRPIFDAPLRLRCVDQPLGTHMFTAMHFEPGDGHVQWLSLTLEGETTTAGEALDRIIIPDKIRKIISPLLTPGSSLIISDDGLSHETFPKATDFVVLTD